MKSDTAKNSSLICFAVCFVAIVIMVFAHQRLDRLVKETADTSGKAYLPSVETARLLALGYDRFAADMFWLAFVQYAGEIRDKGAGYQSAYDFVNLITELDPYFQKAYWFGCWTVGYWQQRPDLANRIMQRGISFNPQEWYMPYMAGINQYLFARNYQEAARYYRQAAKLPNAPDYLDRQAAILESPIPEISKRLQTLTYLYRSSKEGNLKQQAHRQLGALLLQMYQDAPTEQIKQMARKRLADLGFDVEELK